MMKICTKCKKEFPATADYFYRDRVRKDNLRPDCKKCVAKRCGKYQQTERGKEANNRAGRKFVSKNKDKELKRVKLYRKTLNGYLRQVYSNIKSRCNNPKYPRYKDWGGRGIENRFSNFDDFLAYIVIDLGIVSFEQIKGLNIDRINNDGHYEPGNIRFITAKDSCNNRRSSKTCS